MDTLRLIIGVVLFFAAMATTIGTIGLVTSALYFDFGHMDVLQKVYQAVPVVPAVLLMGAGVSSLLSILGKTIGGE